MRDVMASARQWASVAAKYRQELANGALVLIVTGLLLACGGGGGGGGAEPTGGPNAGGGNNPGTTTPVEVVPAALMILAQPADQSVVVGQTATFAVNATGPANYQWERFTGVEWLQIADATQSSYAIASAQLADDGLQLRVVLTSQANGTNKLISSPVKLSVVPQPQPPAVLSGPGDLALSAGQDGTLSVTATGTSLTYRWQRSADGIVPYSDVPNGSDASLRLSSVMLSDDGARFRVVIANDAGTVTSAAARLTVTPAPAAPLFTVVPTDTTAVAGQAITLRVAVTGTPTPTLVWQFSVDGATWTDIAGEQRSEIVLQAVTLADDGKRFRVAANNTSGTVVSPAAQLHVSPQPTAPSIDTQPSDANVGLGGAATFHVAATGTPPPSYQWQISVDGGLTFSNVTGSTTDTYTLGPAVIGDDGKRVRVAVQNGSGSVVSRAATLTVRTAPQILQQPQAQAWRTGLPLPTFQVAAAGNGLSYRWQASPGGSSPYTDIPAATSATVTITPSNADALVRAVVTNQTGDSAVSEPAALTVLRWSYLSPSPTGDAMRALRWASATTVISVGDAGSIVRSIDAGASWNVIAENDLAHAQTLLGLDFGSATLGVAVGEQGVIRRTTDSGSRWLTVRAPSTANAHLVAVSFDDAQTAVAVGLAGTMLRTTDGGSTWNRVAAGVTDDFTAVAFRAHVGLAVTSRGLILRTINGGAQWSTYDAQWSADDRSRIAFVSDTTVVIARSHSVSRSTDAGVTWTHLPQDPLDFYTGDLAFKDGRTGVMLPASRANNSYVTTDGGSTWTVAAGWPSEQQLSAAPAEAAYSVRFGPSGIALATGAHGTLRRSADNGASWTELDQSSIANLEGLIDIAFATPSAGLAISESAIYKTTDGGVHWSVVSRLTPGAIGSWRSVRYVNATTAVALTNEGYLFASQDAGSTWVNRAILPGFDSSWGWGAAFAPGTQVGLVGSRSDTVLRTSDGGTTWAPLPGCAYDVKFVSALVALTSCDSIYRSVDGGQTWAKTFDGIPGSFLGNQFLRMAFGSTNVGIAVGEQGGIARTTDGGATWQLVINPIARFAAKYVAWFTSPTEAFIVAPGAETLRTTDSGLTWSVDQPVRAGGLAAGAALDASQSIVVGEHGAVMRRGP